MINIGGEKQKQKQKEDIDLVTWMTVGGNRDY